MNAVQMEVFASAELHGIGVFVVHSAALAVTVLIALYGEFFVERFGPVNITDLKAVNEINVHVRHIKGVDPCAGLGIRCEVSPAQAVFKEVIHRIQRTSLCAARKDDSVRIAVHLKVIRIAHHGFVD